MLPVLIVLGGLPGVGKTTLSRAVARRLGAAGLRVDAIEAAMWRAGVDPAQPTGLAAYAVAHAMADAQLDVGATVVVDAVNPVVEARQGWRGVAVHMIEVVCSDPDVHRRRVERRESDIEGFRVPTWEQVLAWEYEPWDGEPRLTVDACAHVDTCVDQVLARVRRSAGQGRVTRLGEDAHVLELPAVLGGDTLHVCLTLLHDAAAGATLVDAGVPGLAPAIVAAMAEAGVGPGDLRRVVVTHRHLDHSGSLPELIAATGARVLAHELEAPFLPHPVDGTLADGERLHVAGGVRVVATPGHTPGHLCLYLERGRTLVAGDALLAHRGRLHGPSPEYTADLAAARASVRRLAALDVRAIVCSHGGVVDEDANGQLRRVAAALEPGR